MATRTWDGGSGNWSDATNWDLDTLPVDGVDDIVVPNLGGITTTFDGGSALTTLTILMLTSQEALVVSGGTLTANSTFTVNNSLTVSGSETLILIGGRNNGIH